MKTTQTRKEEAELRQIAKKARLARKESKSRIRKSKLKQIRLAQKGSDNGSNATLTNTNNEVGKPIKGSIHDSSIAATPTAAADEVSHNHRGKRKGAIILPEEVAELKMRFKESENSTNTVKKVHDDLKIKQSAKRTNIKTRKQKLEQEKRRKANGKENVNIVHVKVSSSSNDKSIHLTDMLIEPNYHMEIHFKRKEVLVDVILHHVPFNKINVNESTPQMLVVDTSTHTKKYRLELNMPEGVQVNMNAASFEWEAGVLKCVLPIVNENLPLSLQAEWDAMRDKMQKDKRLRFRLHEDGGLTMRSRQAVLKMKDTPNKSKKSQQTDDTQEEEQENKEHQLKLNTNNLSSQNKNEQSTEEEEEEEEEQEVTKKELVQAHAKHQEHKRKEQKVQINNQHGSNDMNSSSETSKINKANNKEDEKQNVFASERAAAMAIATAVATRAKQSIRERVKLAKEVQQRRQARLEVRSTRKEMKDAKRQESFARVLEEQKQQLLARAALQASIQKEAESHRIAKQKAKGQRINNNMTDKSTSADETKREKKKVRFAEEAS